MFSSHALSLPPPQPDGPVLLGRQPEERVLQRGRLPGGGGGVGEARVGAAEAGFEFILIIYYLFEGNVCERTLSQWRTATGRLRRRRRPPDDIP